MAWRNDQWLFESLPVCISLEFNYFVFFLALTIRVLLSTSFGPLTVSYFVWHICCLIASLIIVYLYKLSMVSGFYSKPFFLLWHSFPSGEEKKKKKGQSSSQVQSNLPCFYLSPELSFGDATFWWQCCVLHNSETHISSIILWLFYNHFLLQFFTAGKFFTAGNVPISIGFQLGWTFEIRILLFLTLN